MQKQKRVRKEQQTGLKVTDSIPRGILPISANSEMHGKANESCEFVTLLHLDFSGRSEKSIDRKESGDREIMQALGSFEAAALREKSSKGECGQLGQLKQQKAKDCR